MTKTTVLVVRPDPGEHHEERKPMAYLSAEERRTSIIDAAIDVIASEGLARATTRRIAERADAPLGALHYCFRGKRELIQVVSERAAATISSAFESVDPTLGVEQTIRDCISSFWGWMRDNPGLQLACIELLLHAIREIESDAAASKLYAHVYEPGGANLLREHISAAAAAEGVELAMPVDEIVRFIIHRFDGLILEYASSRDEKACIRQTEWLAEALIQLAVPKAGARAAASPRRGAKKR